MDILRICRLCAESNCNLHPIFNSMDNYIEKIETFVPIKISESDELPQMICSNCVCKINNVLEFRSIIIKNDEKLRTMTIKNEPEELKMFEITNISNEFDGIKQSDDEYDDINENKTINDIKKHGNGKNGSKICDKCGKLLKRNSFSDHMLNVHGSEPTIECDICGKMVKTRRQLWHHKKGHKREDVSCDKCGKTFTTKAGFKQHYNHIHLGIRKYSCSLCEKMFPRMMTLKRHMRSHTGERPYSCVYCGRSFGGRWNLKQHIRLHTKEKPYKCDLCMEAFTQNVMLKAHVKNKHQTITENETNVI